MNFQEFRKAAAVTESRFDAVTVSPHVVFSVLAISHLSGEIADLLKKQIAYGREFDKQKYAAAVIGMMENIELLTSELKSPEEPIQEAHDALARLNPRLLHGILGKVTEDAELVQAMLKTAYENEPLDLVNIKEELGDGRWYDAIIYNALEELGDEADEEKVQAKVIAKLKVRYADKFSAAEANERNLAAERAVLESSI